MRIRLLLATGLVVTAGLASQQIVIPNGFATTAASSSTAYPWARGAAQVRAMYVYDSPHFTNQSVNTPIVITRIRWRANEGVAAGGGTYNSVVVQLSTAAVDYTLVTATFASNHGTDLQTVYSGPVTVQPTVATTPGAWYVDVIFTTPFVYNPANGDLAIDMATDATGWVGAIGAAMDSAGTAGNTSRVYNLTSWQATTGTTQVGSSPVIEINFAGSSGTATALPYGAGCPASAPLVLGASPRPVIGNTVQLTTTAIPAGSALGAVILSFTQHNPGLPLGGIGMPGCSQYTGLDASVTFLPSGGTGSVPFLIPNNAVYSGMHVFCQSATFSPGVNALGVAASNGVDLGVGTQ